MYLSILSIVGTSHHLQLNSFDNVLILVFLKSEFFLNKYVEIIIIKRLRIQKNSK